MHKPIRVLAPALMILALSGCHPKWYNGRCETSDNCAKQPGFGKVCMYGQCQECGLDKDCKTGFWCRGFQCVPRPECEVPFDCGKGRTCALGKCVAAAPAPQCGPGSGDRACDPGQVCDAGTCRVPPPPPDPCHELGSVFFSSGSAKLTERSRAALAADASCLAAGQKRAIVEGNSDDGKTPEYNVKLGLQRAEAVKKYLLSLGVHRALLSTISYGDTRRACTEPTEDCRQTNRRVDLKIQ